ncbi:MAG: PKD domain-containing protein [Bacteroidales bacterium]|nr:PKD domain-containing protein [Bacteroidales bacterium]
MKNLIQLIAILLIAVSCQKESVNLKIDSGFILGDTLLRVNERLDISNLSNDETLIYFWDFGDGTTSMIKNPIHSYNKPGKYTLKLRVTNKTGNSDSTLRKLKVGEFMITEIEISDVSDKKWYSPLDNWDQDSLGISAYPDIYVEIKEQYGPSLYHSAIKYNVEAKVLPVKFQIPDIKISGLESTGIYINDNDGNSSEEMVSNLMSGITIQNLLYDKINHEGQFTIGLASSFTVKYKVR